MKLHFLGTGAADWNIAMRSDGVEWRRFSSALLDDTLLFDPGPHIFDYAEKSGTPRLFDGIKNIIVTHSHPDHFHPETVKTLSENVGCRVYGDEACLRKLNKACGKIKVDFVRVKPYEKFNAGEHSVLPLPSNHATDDPYEQTLNYVVAGKDKTMFYGLDTGWLPYETWRVIRKIPFDCMVLELTIGDNSPGDDRIFSHTSIPMLKIMLETFRAQGCAPRGCKIIVSHLAKTLHADHAATVKLLEPLGVDVAYDGLIYEF